MTNEQTNPLAAIEAMEAKAFRVGQVARRLLAEHSGLISKAAKAYSHGYDDMDSAGQLELRASGLDEARTLAAALGIELGEPRIFNSYPGPRGYVHGETEVDGVRVVVSGSGLLPEDQAAAWRTEQDQAAAAKGGDGR